MRLLVTGAGGFIGSYLIRRLARPGTHDVLAAVRPGRAWHASAGITTLPWDLRVSQPPPAAPVAIDAVVYLAQANVSYPEAAVELHAVNVGGALVLLDYARRCGARSFVLASSGSVYGYGERPWRENDPPRPADFYGLTKVHAEQLVGAYQQFFSTCVLRLFAPYGPGQTGRLIPGLIERVRHGRPVTLRDGGRPRMNPIFIEDVLTVLEAALTLPGHHVINAAGEEALSIRDMAEAIGGAVGRRPVYEEVAGGPPGDMVGDTRRLRKLLGPGRLIPFRDGIRTMLAAQSSALSPQS